MGIKEVALSFLFFAGVTAIFFYKTFLLGFVPFPGDLLISEYNPWKTYSYLGYNPGSYPSKVQYFDVLRQLYPWKTFSIASFKNSQLPLWNPYNFSGAPLLANIQSAVFYPLNFLYFLLPQLWAWSTLIFLEPLLAAFFTFLYSRKIGLSQIASAFAGISFAFSSFMTVWLEYNTIGQVILWLPLVLLAIEHLLGKKKYSWILVFIFALLSALFAGHIQIFGYFFVFSAIYCFVRGGRSLFFLILFLLPLGLGAIQLVPSLELISEAARSSHPYDFFIHKILIQPWQLIMLFVPDFFGNPATHNYFPQDTFVGKVTSIGLIPLFFTTLIFFRKKNRIVKFFLYSSTIILLFATLNPITYFFYKIHIPFISDSAPTLAIFLLCFSLSMLAGFGIDLWRQPSLTWQKEKPFSFLVLFVIFWLGLLLVPKQFVSISLHNLIYSTGLLMLAFLIFLLPLFYKKGRAIVLVCLFLLTIFDLWHSFEKFNPFSPKETVFPVAPVVDFLKKTTGINRFWGYKSAAIDANFATQVSLFSTDGYDPLYPRRYGEFIQASYEGKIITQFTNQTRSDAVLSFNQPKVLDLLGVKYVLDRAENASAQKVFPIDRFSLIYEQNGWKIFENKKALPRAFLVGDYRVAKTPQDFEKTFFAKDFDPSRTVVLEEGVSQRLNNSGHLSSVQVVSYTPNEVTLKINADGDRLLFLSDAYFPGWKGYIDGKATKIYRADYAFRAVFVPAGLHAVKFIYDPTSFKLGFAITFLTLLIVVTTTILWVVFKPTTIHKLASTIHRVVDSTTLWLNKLMPDKIRSKVR